MGGVKYYSEDGKNIELEGDEFVFSNEKHKKYGKLLHAMNFDDFNGLTTSDAGVVELFKKLGFATDISQARKSGNELQLSLMSIGLDYGKNTSMDEVKRINQTSKRNTNIIFRWIIQLLKRRKQSDQNKNKTTNN